jgi:MYXO-CTERM domain-containing protein
VESAVLRLHKSLATSTSADARSLGRAVDDLVMRPVRDLLDGASRVLVAPDGALNLVPFAALVDEEGRYLVDRFDFTYLTSGRDLLRQELQTASRSRPMVFANPAFGRPSPEPPPADPRSRRSGSLRDAIFPALPGTASEARALAQILPDPEVLVDTAATETALKKASGPRLLHVATHGFFLPDQGREQAPSGDGRGVVAEGADVGAVENPLLRSGLAFAGANGLKSGEDDGILTAFEASGLDLDGTDLVVLSACETGLGDVLNGDGVYGIRRALFLAGAKTEVTSLWKVDDKATRDLMVQYYDKLFHGGGRSASLRDVQRAMLAKKGTEHPYFWASFVVSGDPSPLALPKVTAPEVPKVPPTPKGCGCEVGGAAEGSGGAAVLVAVVVALMRTRRSRRQVR